MIAEVCGTTVAYEIQGKGENRILLLHGWGCNRNVMQPVADALAAEHQILLIDFPGHGESGRPPQPWGVPEYADCLLALLRQLDFIPCSVIAHSFGCRVAVWIAAHDAGVFPKIVLTGAAGIRATPSEALSRKSARYRRLRKACDRLGMIPLFGSVAENWKEKLIQKYGSPDYRVLDEEMRKTFVKVINQDLSELYPRVKQSTLLVWGDADTETPLWMGQKMEKLIPDAGLVILEGGSHFAFLEQSQRFNAIVRFFMKEDKQ